MKILNERLNKFERGNLIIHLDHTPKLPRWKESFLDFPSFFMTQKGQLILSQPLLHSILPLQPCFLLRAFVLLLMDG